MRTFDSESISLCFTGGSNRIWSGPAFIIMTQLATGNGPSLGDVSHDLCRGAGPLPNDADAIRRRRNLHSTG